MLSGARGMPRSAVGTGGSAFACSSRSPAVASQRIEPVMPETIAVNCASQSVGG